MKKKFGYLFCVCWILLNNCCLSSTTKPTVYVDVSSQRKSRFDWKRFLKVSLTFSFPFTCECSLHVSLCTFFSRTLLFFLWAGEKQNRMIDLRLLKRKKNFEKPEKQQQNKLSKSKVLQEISSNLHLIFIVRVRAGKSFSIFNAGKPKNIDFFVVFLLRQSFMVFYD